MPKPRFRRRLLNLWIGHDEAILNQMRDKRRPVLVVTELRFGGFEGTSTAWFSKGPLGGVEAILNNKIRTGQKM